MNSPKKSVNKNFFNCTYVNADNLMNKREELEAMIAIHSPDIICVSEFLPKNTSTPVQEPELNLVNYDLCSNISCAKRGVVIYVASSLKMNPIDFSQVAVFEESAWVEIKLKGNDKLLIGCVYRSPNSQKENNAKLISGIESVCARKDYSHLVICGDFNLPDINWKQEETSASESHISFKFLESIKNCFLTQHVVEPTHFRGEQKANVLDLIFTNTENTISDLEYGAPIGSSHHVSLRFKIICYSEQTSKGRKTFRYTKGDYTEMRKLLSRHDWDDTMSEKSCLESWMLLTDLINEGMDACIPKGYNQISKPGRALWMNESALIKVKKKSAAYQRYRETKEGAEHELYARARNQARWATRRAKKEFEKKIAKEAKSNPKAFYKYANSKLKVRAGIADLDTPEGKATTDRQKAEALNSFFTSVFTRENTDDVPQPQGKDVDPISDLFITEAMVKKKLKLLNPNKSSGPDGLHPRILSELSEIISKPLSLIMQKSLDEGILPQDWKDAHVCPIFKKGKKNLTTNYRPVSLTSVVCKVMESIIKDHIMEHITRNNLMTDAQHGFVPGRSCSTQLISCLEIWTEIIDRGSSLDSIYLDFSKAFDSVPHQRLARKLEGFGIKGHVLQWLQDFLNNRRQKVRIGDEESEWEQVLSGVPQGSVIGPTLFIIFINDMPDVVQSFIELFADDAKVFAEIKDDHHNGILQEDIVALQGWAEKWQLAFNAKKCKVMHIGRNNPKREYIMDEEKLQEVECEKDLGVWVDNQLRMQEHTANQVKKANKLLGMIRRSFTYLDSESLCILYKSLIRTHLEYANTVTSPQTEREAILLENVQRRATKMVPAIAHLDYVDRLRELKLPSLKYRRRRGDMIETFKYTHNINKVNPSPLPLEQNSTTRGHSYKLEKRRSNKSARQKFFTMRVVNNWNSLPENIVNAPNINTFKNRLDKHWATHHYDLPNI